MARTWRRRVRPGWNPPPKYAVAPAPVHQVRTECPLHPEKRAHASRNQAWKAAATRIADATLSIYQCPGCSRFHLTSTAKVAPR